MELRNLSPDETRLVRFLVNNAENVVIQSDLFKKIKVVEMDDGGMGSLKLYPEGCVTKDNLLGKQACACLFFDNDGVEVLA